MIISHRVVAESLKILLKHNAVCDPETSAARENPLYLASREGHKDVVSELISRGVVVDRKALGGESSFMAAARFRRLETAEQLLRSGADINFMDTAGNTALIRAVFNDDDLVTQFLLQRKCSVSIANYNGETALTVACRLGHVKMATKLAEHGADINSRDEQLQSPLISAIMANIADVAMYLIDMRADLEIADIWGSTALMHSVQNCALNRVSARLLDAGCDVNRADRRFMTALMHACASNNIDCALLLIRRGGDLSMTNDDGLTAIQLLQDQSVATILQDAARDFTPRPSKFPLSKPKWLEEVVE